MAIEPSAGAGTSFDPKAFRRALGQFATGVSIVTTREPNGTPRGFTVNSFTSVSLDPPLVLVCIGKSAASLPIFTGAPGFAITILAEHQRETAGLFASQRPDKFDVTEWHDASSGMPIIDGGLAWLDCARHDVVDAGDHVILIGRVTGFDYQDGPVLGYLRGSFFTLGLEATLADAAGKGRQTFIGAILEQDGAILLQEDRETKMLRVPSVGGGGSPASLSVLEKHLASSGMTVTIDFVYAVYEDTADGDLLIYYRGRVHGAAPNGSVFHQFDALPLDRVANAASRTMLTRYANEARQGTFAVYMGDENTGVVRPVG